MGKWHEKEMFCCLNQKSANYNPWAKSGQLHAFVNKILLEHGHVHLYIVYECFHATWAELNSFDRIVYGLQNRKYLLVSPLQRSKD